MNTESKRRAGFDVVYEECKDLVFRIAVKYTNSVHDAEDLAQEAFFRFYICNSHQEIKSPRRWLAVTVSNLALNYVKHSRHEILLSENEDIETLVECGASVEDDFFDNMWRRELIEYTDRILNAVSRRNKRWYDALTYAYCMELPRQDIADCMGITLDALQGILLRAKNWIRENYKEEFDYITKA